MTASQSFECWAPSRSPWSRWAKPALFADQRWNAGSGSEVPSEPWRQYDLSWAPKPFEGTAIIVDLPGDASVFMGLALATIGFQPVPLYNCVCGPPAVGPVDIVPVDRVIAALREGATALVSTEIPPDAPPVFLLDSKRSGGASIVSPGRFDNRWVVFPQDFPSGNFLLGKGVKRVVVVQESQSVASDLAHVLLRWKEARIELLHFTPGEIGKPVPLAVHQPSSFGRFWYRFLVTLKLRRNSAGGFGSIVPQPQSGGRYG